MTETPAIRTDITAATPLKWELRGGRLFIETDSGDMENVFDDKSNRVTRSEATTILEEEFNFQPSDVFSPSFFDGLQNTLSDSPTVDEYESLIGDLVDTAAAIPGIDAKHTTISDEGMVWTSTQNYERKGVALVVLKNVDPQQYRTRTAGALADLGERLPAALKNASDRAEGNDGASLLGLMKVLETIGGADSHALLKVQYAGKSGQIFLGSQFYAGINADLIFLPERLLPTRVGDERTIREMDQIWARGDVSPDEGARLDIDIPPALLEMMERVVDELNAARVDPSSRKVTKSTLFRLAIRQLEDTREAVTISEDASREILSASDEDLVGTTVYLEPDVYDTLYDFAEAFPDAREQAIVRTLVSAVTTALANAYGVEGWIPARTPLKDERALYDALRDADLLRDIDLPERN